MTRQDSNASLCGNGPAQFRTPAVKIKSVQKLKGSFNTDRVLYSNKTPCDNEGRSLLPDHCLPTYPVLPGPQTSRGYFGSPHLRGTISSTTQLWSETLGEERDAVLKAISSKELKRRESIHEIVSTEAQYLKDLLTIITLFR